MLSHPIGQYFIPCAGLASEFGMGSGVALHLWPFGTYFYAYEDLNTFTNKFLTWCYDNSR